MKWDLDNVKDLTNKIILITGCTSGMGYEACKFLSSKGATVIMACRNYERGNIAKEKILKEVSNAKLGVMAVDVSDLDSVRNFAKEVKNKYDKLDILINNAGVEKARFEKSKQGYEMTFATNYLGHFLLTALLLELLNKPLDARIIMYSSNGHLAGNGNFLITENDKYKSLKVYGNSKLACLMYAYKLDSEFKKRNINIKVVGVHSGWIITNLAREHNTTKMYDSFVKMIGMPANLGIRNAIYGATSNDIKGGEYIVPDGFMTFRGYPKIYKSSKLSYNTKFQDDLWKLSEKLTDINMEEILKNV